MIKISDHRLTGNIAELKFYLKAHELGFTVSRPFGDIAKYDFIVDTGTQLLKIQVKAKSKKDPSRNDRYTFLIAHGRKVKTLYTKLEVDIAACYVTPEDVWYIIPIAHLQSANIGVYPHRTQKDSKYEQYKEAWHLIK